MGQRSKVLVTGVSGFTGSRLARSLLERGYEVHGLVRASSRVGDLREQGVILHQGDLGDGGSIESAMRGIDAVYHIAASYREGGLPEHEYYKVNVSGTRHVIEAALRHGVRRYIHCSTVGVHGHIEAPPANEDAPFRPDDPYQKTKLQAEELVRQYMGAGLPAVIFRPVGIYGPGDTRFLKLFRAINRGRFVMFGTGEVLYHLTYIDDLTRGILACGESDRALGKTFIIAGEKAVTLNVLVEQIATLLGVKKPSLHVPFWLLWSSSIMCEALCRPLRIRPPLYRRRAEFFVKDRAFDGSKIEHELGFKPAVALEEGLRRTVAWYREQQLL